MAKLSTEEKQIIDNIEKAIPKLSDEERSRVLIFSEAIALLADRSFKMLNT